MKRMSLYLVALAWIVPAYGSDDSRHKVGGGITLASDYLFRGISQTDNHPAIQGSLEYGYEPWGVYLGTWASNVNSMTSDGEIEIRWLGGLRGDLAATGIAWDLGVVYYHYPGDDLEPEKDYVEPKLGLSHEFAGLPLTPRVSASVHYSPDFYLEAGDAVYVDGTVGMSLPYGFSLAFHVGYQTVDAVDIADLDVDGDDSESYLDWRVGISKEVLGFGLDVSYWDAENEEVFCGLGSQNCRGTVVGTISRKF